MLGGKTDNTHYNIPPQIFVYIEKNRKNTKIWEKTKADNYDGHILALAEVSHTFTLANVFSFHLGEF